MANRIFTDELKQIVITAVRNEIESEIDSAIQRIQFEVEQSVRRKTAQICANVFTHFDFVMDQGKFIVTVDFKNTSSGS